MLRRASVVGRGTWGIAVASILKNNGVETVHYSRRGDCSECSIEELRDTNVSFIAIDSKHIMEFLRANEEFLPLKLCICSKGIVVEDEHDSDEFLLSRVSGRFFSERDISFMFGPSFSDEVVKREKTILTIASKDAESLEEISGYIENGEYMEVERTSETELVECFGIFKNIIAIASGVVSASSDSVNLKTRVVLKMIKELCGVGEKLGANPHKIFATGCGFGDIFLSATSSKSRNYSFGYGFVKNPNNPTKDMTVEGVRSVKTIPKILRLCGVKAPLLEALHDFVFCKCTLEQFLGKC